MTKIVHFTGYTPSNDITSLSNTPFSPPPWHSYWGQDQQTYFNSQQTWYPPRFYSEQPPQQQRNFSSPREFAPQSSGNMPTFSNRLHSFLMPWLFNLKDKVNRCPLGIHLTQPFYHHQREFWIPENLNFHLRIFVFRSPACQSLIPTIFFLDLIPQILPFHQLIQWAQVIKQYFALKVQKVGICTRFNSKNNFISILATSVNTPFLCTY